jgi:hypothetical protein
MLLKANKYRKDKKADCRQNELGSRIFVGRVFVDYAKCLHFYPSFSYGRIIAGEKPGAFLRQPIHFCPQCGQFWGFTRAFQTQRKTAGGRCGMKKARRFKGNRGVPTKNTR